MSDNNGATDVDGLPIFTSGFETGNLSEWSTYVQATLGSWERLGVANEASVSFAYDLASLDLTGRLSP